NLRQTTILTNVSYPKSSKKNMNIEHPTSNIEFRMSLSVTQRRRLRRVSLYLIYEKDRIPYSMFPAMAGFDIGYWTFIF
ncbi:MAG: hypothetical protein DRI24_17940, partial [Deltaproteobacteria bacterium]